MADYSDATAILIERMCRNIERKSFRLNTSKVQEAILNTYDLFGLPRPKNVVWCKDIFDAVYQDSAFRAFRAFSAFRAFRASSAFSASRAFSAFRASSAFRAFRASSAFSASRAFRASSAFSASRAFSAFSASSLDYDFDWFIFAHEYYQNPDADYPPNDEDRKYLAYSELLMDALEAGAGYMVEWKDTIYIVPSPLVTIDEQNRYHSDVAPAIRWKGGGEFYYLRGENFEKELWQKITSQTITAEEVMKISDIDKRTIAISMLAPGEMLKQLHAELIHTGVKGNRLYKCPNFMDTGAIEYALVMDDASTPRQFIKFVPPEVGQQANADIATAAGYKDAEGNSMPVEDYLLIEQEA